MYNLSLALMMFQVITIQADSLQEVKEKRMSVSCPITNLPVSCHGHSLLVPQN